MRSDAPLLTRSTSLVLLAAFGAFTNVNLLLPVLPLYVVRSGGSDYLAGLTTTALLLATVAAQVLTPRILRLCGHKIALIASLMLIGFPSALYLWASSPVLALGITLLRGLGFGVATVAFVALVTALSPPARRGEGIGLYGIVSTLPAVFALPFGLWLITHIGYETVFLMGAVVPVLGILAVLAARVRMTNVSDGSVGLPAVLGRPYLRRPLLAFGSTTVAAGVLVTFLPLAAPERGPGSATMALLAWGLVQTGARWWAGRFTDSFGAYKLLRPSLILSGLGMLAITFSDNAPLLLLGTVLNGAGFGSLQNATLSVLMDRVPSSEYGLVSTLWNVGFDAGAAVGPLAFGLLVTGAGYPATFAATGILIFAALHLVHLDTIKR